jgi:hypothetical protein
VARAASTAACERARPSSAGKSMRCGIEVAGDAASGVWSAINAKRNGVCMHPLRIQKLTGQITFAINGLRW